MSSAFHRPVRRPSGAFDNVVGTHDAASSSRLAHETASALLARTRADKSGQSADKLVAFTAEHGIDDIAQLWAHAPAHSLPGALWRLHVIQLAIHSDPALAAMLYERGRVQLSTADVVVAGAPAPASPEELMALIDTILRGAFRGDFAMALDRAAAYCRVQASGALHLADDHEATEPDRASGLTRRALRLSEYAGDLTTCARLWRRDGLV